MKKVTVYSGFTKSLEDITLDDFLGQIKNGTYSEMVLKVRQLLKEGKKEKAQLTKKQLRAVTISAIYLGGRKEEFMTEYQGTLVIDIDDITPQELTRIKELVNADVHTYASFESPGGGLKVIVMVTDKDNGLPLTIHEIKDFHKQMYNHVMEYYQRLTGTKIDVSGKDITRLCFFSYDPEMYLNHGAIPFVQTEVTPPREPSRPKRIDKVFREALNEMRKTSEYKEGNRNNFIFHIANILNRNAISHNDARTLCNNEFKDIDTSEILAAVDSAYSHTDEFGAIKKQKKNVLIGKAQTFLTEHYDVRYNVVSTKLEIRLKELPTEGNELATSGAEQATTSSNLPAANSNLPTTSIVQSTDSSKQAMGDTEQAAQSNELPATSSNLPTANTNQPTKGSKPIEPSGGKARKQKPAASVKKKSELLFTDKFTVMNDRIESSVWRAVNNAGIKVNITVVRQLLNSDLFGEFNPFEYYFYSLPKWNGKDYIGELAATIRTDNDDEYWRFCLEKWITAMVASLLDKNVVNHLMIILNSSQGLGKTQWIQNILPPELSDYFAMASLVEKEKDLLLKFCYHAVILLDEMDAFSQRELSLVKKLITQNRVDERKAYAHNEEKYTRYASLMATTNNQKMLSDPTGSRRFAPFNIIKMNYQFKIDYRQLYAQVMHNYLSGYRFWLNLDEIDQLNAHNEAFQLPVPEEEFLLTYFTKERIHDNPQYLTASEILRKISLRTGLRITTNGTIILGKILHKYKFTTARRSKGTTYLVYEISDDEVKRRQKLESNTGITIQTVNCKRINEEKKLF